MVLVCRTFAGVLGVVAVDLDGVFRRTSEGVCDLCGVLDIDGLGVSKLSLTCTRDEANRLAAGDIDAKRSRVDRMCGEAMFRRAVSMAFAF